MHLDFDLAGASQEREQLTTWMAIGTATRKWVLELGAEGILGRRFSAWLEGLRLFAGGSASLNQGSRQQLLIYLQRSLRA